MLGKSKKAYSPLNGGLTVMNPMVQIENQLEQIQEKSGMVF